jgi:hypothetical protein
MGIVSGQKIQMIACRNRIELILLKPITQMRGFLKGIETIRLNRSFGKLTLDIDDILPQAKR